MNKTLTLYNNDIKIAFEPGIIRIHSDFALWRYLDGNANERFNFLVKEIKNEYSMLYGIPLKISNHSLMVEILVHVYCDYLGLLFNRKINIPFLQKIVCKLLERAEVVDCGEKKLDSNRWVWDALSSFKNIFVKLLPDNLSGTGLKNG